MKIKLNKNLLKIFKNKKNNNIETIHYLIAAFKEYGIQDIIASPGTQNAGFNYIVQEDKFFNCYSVIDERSAAYVATGLIHETGLPAVITCTGATASRNYLSALTESYYRNIPLIALTFYDPNGNDYAQIPQHVNRSISQKDIKRLSIELPNIKNGGNLSECLMLINAALSTAFYKKVPVHINCPAGGNFNEIDSKLVPNKIWKTEYYFDNFDILKESIEKKRTAIFIGSHSKFDKETLSNISNFVEKQNIPVFCDHTSSYHGANKVLISQGVKSIPKTERPEFIIDIGNVCGDYSAYSLFMNADVCRISPLGDYTCRYYVPVTKLYTCTEKMFFNNACKYDKLTSNNYYNVIKTSIPEDSNLDLPLCNALICKYLAKYLPEHCSLNVSILNSLRNINFMNLHESIDVNCNVGGFGIDGALSTLVGMSLSNKEKLFFGLIGDLAFFYDMNILGNRHIQKNLRIILVNNNRGEEFRLNPQLENNKGEKSDLLVAAAAHNINGAKAWAESCGFHYMNTTTKENLENLIKDFCKNDFNKPVLFEIFTTHDDEKKGLSTIRNKYGQ